MCNGCEHYKFLRFLIGRVFGLDSKLPSFGECITALSER